MEITSFVLGMLTIVAVITLTTIVVGMIKINKLTKEKNSLQQTCSAIENDFRSEIGHLYRHIDETNRETNQRMEESGHNLYREISETRSYIDSRLDKLVAKQVIKG